MSNQNEKYCSKCKKLKPISEFYSYEGRTHSVCKQCVCEKAAEWKREKRKSPEYRAKEYQKWRERYHTDEVFRQSQLERCKQHQRRKKVMAMVEAATPKTRKDLDPQVCSNCVNYPCFEGIETISSNLAKTCHSWTMRRLNNIN